MDSGVHTQDRLLTRYQSTRAFTETLCETLSDEDCVLQTMPDVSPTRWHLAHTTWFFEQFVLSASPDYQVFDRDYAYLFNSYYNTIGDQFPRASRGLLSRPGVERIRAYRYYVDEQIQHLFSSAEALPTGLRAIIETGIHHEQQHQELILTDIKHILSRNPLKPVFRHAKITKATPEDGGGSWLSSEEGLHRIGHSGEAFAFDNESPHHRVFVESFLMSPRLVTCGQFLEFINDGGYRRPELWLSLGWEQVRANDWKAPLYWQESNGQWQQFTLAGAQAVDPSLPVCHVSFFEADAFARWSQARLPTEVEWEVATDEIRLEGNFVDTLLARDRPIHPSSQPASTQSSHQFFGDVWEWTASPYTAYPGYAPAVGALGEYNGKFMCNQYVLRGGSCATSSDHIRRTYRNFFPPEARWQFSGLRLARNA